MAQRDQQQLDVIWVHADLRNSSRANELLAAAEAGNLERLPAAVLSVNRRVDGQEALIKVLLTAATFQGRLSGPVRQAILRVYTEIDHAEALALVSALGWTGPPQDTPGS